MSKVKICGLGRMADIKAVNDFLPDYIGFVFAQSKRKVDVKEAEEFKKNLNPQIQAVGVFVNEDIDKLSEIYKNGIIDIIQLHGDESDDYIKNLKDKCGCTIIKAVGIGDRIPALPTEADYLLFDTLSEQRGGIGKAFDGKILKDYCGIPYFLAGGLNAENVEDSIDMLNPFCVDISSGVESNGKKDAEKIKEFIYLVRNRGGK